MTLALLLTAVTGAWAISDPNAVYWDYQTWTGWEENVTTHTVGDITITCSGNAKAYESTSSGEPLALQAGANDAITFTSNGKPFASIAIMTDDELNVAGWTYNSSTRSYEWSGEPTTSVTLSGCDINADYIIFTFGTAEAPITVEPVTGQQNQWTFAMPGSDVVLTPQYAPAAKWAVVDNVEQKPAALEGIIAGQDEAIVTAGQSAQGTVMYAVTTSADAAPALTAFSATVPTAKDYDDATTLYVWYYIQGHDNPDGQQATEENTFNDSEISTTPLTVQVLTNKFDIQFTAANDNTIEAGKATVTVDGTAATVTDGKLQGVKMGREVKMTAKEGYKFRKVEVKKGGGSLIVNPVVGQVIGSDGKNYAADATLTDGVTPVAMIAYVSGSHGLAIALADEGANLWVPWMYWDTAVTTAAAHTPAITGGTWKLPSQDEWKQMFSANGGNEDSYTGLNTALSTAGGNILTESGTYWSSSEVGENASKVYFNSGNTSWSQEGKNEAYSVRACLAF